MFKTTGSALLGQKRAQIDKKPNSISPEEMVTGGSVTPRNNRKLHVSIVVLYLNKNLDNRKRQFRGKGAKNDQKA